MHHFQYKGKSLYCEDVPVTDIAARMGTPLYLYSHATLAQHFKAFDSAFEGMDHLTCFSVKSNSNVAILRLFAGLGGGMDIVSAGELFRALRAGVEPRKIVYSGVGKKEADLEYALSSNILLFNIESVQEIRKLNEIAARMRIKAGVSFRVNPDVDPKTHPYISTGLKENKFGIDIKEALDHYKMASGLSNVVVKGVSCHIGSQLTEVSPFVDALKKVEGLIDDLAGEGIKIDFLDLGGGLGITYDKETPPHPKDYAESIENELGGRGIKLILEPGRVIMGNAGIFVSRVLYTKSSGEKNFFVVDGAMNDLMRPSLYNSFHAIQEVTLSGRETVKADVVGPICESGDFLAKSREMKRLEPGELIAVMSAGAYGFSMSSNYNSRPRACEVMVKGDRFYTIRSRENLEDLVRGEVIPEFLMGEN